MSVSISSVLDQIKEINKKDVTTEEILNIFSEKSNFLLFEKKIIV